VSTPSNPTAQPWSHFDTQTITLAIGRTPKVSTLTVLRGHLQGGLHSVSIPRLPILGCTEHSVRFRVGHRACLGRKFSEVESVSVLVHLLRDHSVHLDKNGNVDVERARETFSNAYVRITADASSSSLGLQKENTNGLELSPLYLSSV